LRNGRLPALEGAASGTHPLVLGAIVVNRETAVLDEPLQRRPLVGDIHETNSLRRRHDGDLRTRLCETDSQRGLDRSLSCGTVRSDSGGFNVVTVAVLELQD
jgi:hypothetical protein